MNTATPEATYTVTLTGAELDHLRRAYRLAKHEIEVASALAALDAAKLVKPKRNAPPPAERRPLVSQGDPALDAFIAKHHDPAWRARFKKAIQPKRHGMVSMPTPAPGIARRPMSQQERADLYRTHVISSSVVR